MMIRPAKSDETGVLTDMARRFYATTDYAKFATMDDGTVGDLIKWLIEDGVVLVAEVDGRLVGMVGVATIPFMFNENVLMGHEVAWWVDPAFQKGGIGKSLLAAVAPACKAKGVVAVQMLHLATSPPEAGALYERMGYKMSEVSYTKEL